MQALSAVSSHSNNLDQLAGGGKQDSLAADADGSAHSLQGQDSAGDASMQGLPNIHICTDIASVQRVC